MDSKTTINHLNWLVDQTSEILDLAKERKAEINGAINWGDLRCIEARYVMANYGEEMFEVVISEADPSQPDLSKFIFVELQKRDIHLTYPVFEW